MRSPRPPRNLRQNAERMSRVQILAAEPQPNGLTRITVDVDGVSRATVSLATITVHTVTEPELLDLVATAVATQRPPARS